MLRKSYSHGIIGLNYISLVYGIISLKNGDSCVLIDDSELAFANKWYLNIGYTERAVLLKLGDQYDISCLKNLDNYLTEKNTVLYLNEKMIELSNSPYANIKEIARKFPECFSEVYQKRLIDVSHEVFDNDFFEFLDEIANSSSSLFANKKLNESFNHSKNLELTEVFESFLNFLDEDKLVTKQLHYVLQVMFQTVFSAGKNELETKYLLTSLLSPRYEIDYKSLQEDLIFEYRKYGGDMRNTSIRDWGITDNKLKFILLDAIDGIVKVENTFYFGQAKESLPFKSREGGTQFLSISLKGYVDHEFVALFRNKRIVFSQEKRMGSDFPYWEISINEDGLLEGVYSFADYQGTKPSFYYHHALEDLFQSLEMMLPGFIKADWISRAKMVKGNDVWFEFKPDHKADLHPHSKKDFAHFYNIETKQKLDGIEQCGPNRAKSLGLYSYLLDIFSS
jgi:hypothetical protein